MCKLLAAAPTPCPVPRPTHWIHCSWKKVGWIFAQSTKERDFIMSSEEICQMAAVQVSGQQRGCGTGMGPQLGVMQQERAQQMGDRCSTGGLVGPGCPLPYAWYSAWHTPRVFQPPACLHEASRRWGGMRGLQWRSHTSACWLPALSCWGARRRTRWGSML